MSERRDATPHGLDRKHVSYSGRMVILGFGSIGQGVLPLLLRHIDMPRANISIVTAEEREIGRAHV